MITPLYQQLGPLARRTRRIVAGGGAFNPYSVGTVVLDLDATVAGSFTLASGLVADWADARGGSGFHATQAAPTNQPLYIAPGGAGINALASVDFGNQAGTSMNLPSTLLTGVTALTVFWVALNRHEGDQEGVPVNTWGGSGLPCAHPYSDGRCYNDAGSTVRSSFAFTAGSLLLPQVYMICGDNTQWLWKQGATAVVTLGSNTFGAGTSPVIGSGNGWDWTGKLGRIIAYSSALSPTNQAYVYNGLKAIWGTA